TVTLTVLDEETGQPVADAEVRIRNEVDRRTHVFRTDSRGRLRFECASKRGEPMGAVEVRKNGYVPLGEGWGYGDGQDPPEALTLRLCRGTAMGGLVVYEADRPIEGITVVMTVTRYGPGRRSPNPTGIEFYNEIPLRAGPDGRWRTDSVPPG